MGVYHVRLLDETAFSFLDSNKSPGALRACKRADSRLRSAKSRPRYQGKKDLRETPTQTESTGHSGTGGCSGDQGRIRHNSLRSASGIYSVSSLISTAPPVGGKDGLPRKPLMNS